MKYKVERLYPTEQYGNIKYSAEEIETIEDIKKVEAKFDELAKDYKQNEDKPSISLRCGNEWFRYNQKEGKLYKQETKEKIPTINQEQSDSKGKAPF